jgi:DNA-directed RNA polymerase subunit N (RpoN/RPB10)
MRTQLILALMFVTCSLCGQDKKDNYSFFKLYVTNDKQEVLLVKWEDQWEIAGSKYNESLSIKEFLNKMADDMGIKIIDPKLCGMFTQKWKGNNPPTIMQYYKAKFSGGALKPPSDCTDIKWFSFDEAIKNIPYEVMTSMMKEIKKNPGKVIGAAFERYKDANNVTKYVAIEDFYIMN